MSSSSIDKTVSISQIAAHHPVNMIDVLVRPEIRNLVKN